MNLACHPSKRGEFSPSQFFCPYSKPFYELIIYYIFTMKLSWEEWFFAIAWIFLSIWYVYPNLGLPSAAPEKHKEDCSYPVSQESQ